MLIPIDLGKDSYDIVFQKGGMEQAANLLNLNRHVLIVTDDGVPAQFSAMIARQCKEPTVVCFPSGEDSKSFDSFRHLLSTMLANGFGRSDCVVAVGGGVMGDLAGYAAASYMRGVDFYNIPTTVLSQVDSSIGGKTAINLDGIKNVVGAFYQPKRVLIDVQALITLPDRQIANGLAEALKMAVTFDESLVELFEKGRLEANLEEIIERSLRIKKRVVEQDEKEKGVRKALNFGHTLGHGIESQHDSNGLYHGECVALGMIPMCSEPVRSRLIPILRSLRLPTGFSLDPDAVMRAVEHDKKADGNLVTAVVAETMGAFELRRMSMDELRRRLVTLPAKEEEI